MLRICVCILSVFFIYICTVGVILTELANIGVFNNNPQGLQRWAFKVSFLKFIILNFHTCIRIKMAEKY